MSATASLRACKITSRSSPKSLHRSLNEISPAHPAFGDLCMAFSMGAIKFQRLLPERPTPKRCVEAYYLQRPGFESIAERKLRRRQLTEDGNVEISGRDLL
jgi:hypothetical protein